MDKYVCMMCGHTYDPLKGESREFRTILCNSSEMESYQCKPGEITNTYIKPGTDFSALPADWKCPTCGYPKTYYRKQAVDSLTSMRTISY
jgi:rubredoxin